MVKLMSSEKLFQKNTERFSRITPQVALQLQYVDASDIEVCETRKKELNFKRKHEDEVYYYHSNYNAAKEAETWFKSLNMNGVDLLYVFGVGAGHYYDAVKPWLEEDPSHYLVFIEDDLTVLRRFMETEKATQVLDDRQVQLHYFKNMVEGGPMFDWVVWYFIRCQPEVSALAFYDREREDLARDLRKKILHQTVNIAAVSSEYLRFGASFFRNYYSNLLYIDRSHHGNGLFGKFEGVPAVICGAGPSLNKNCELLRELGDDALVLTGGSALNALSARGILPHFGGGIDPNPTQQERLMTNQAFDVPFFYRQRMHFRAFQTIHGSRLFINGAGGYQISEWFEKQLGIEGAHVDEGNNVINFLTDIAYFLGCDPIIFVGMDLAYTDMQSYASGVISDSKVDEKAIQNKSGLDNAAFLRDDINGKPVYTLWKWVGESEWLADYIHRRPDRTFVNATEGGIGFEGVANMTLEEVKEKYLSTPLDLKSRVHSEIQNAKFTHITTDKVLNEMKDFYDNLEHCAVLCEGLLGEAEEMEKRIKSGEKVPSTLLTGKASFFDSELMEQPAYQHVLVGVGFILTKTFERRFHQVKHDWTLKNEADRNLRMLELNREKVEFIKQAADVNKSMMEAAIEDYKKNGYDIGPFEDVIKEKESK